jgi:diguanylate cyclase (GGDEF)-like protein
MLQATLEKWGYEVLTCADGSEAWDALQKDDCPKLAIMDWMMPEMDGPTICGKLREQHDRPYTYVILVTSRDRREDLLAGLDAGADDYVIKPFDPTELELRLRIGQRIVQLQEQLIAARDAFEYQAAHDSLTGLWNRRAVLDLLAKELSRARREHGPLSVVIVDIDKFKNINDTHGHLAGDSVLCEVAETIQASVRAYDSVGRYGGEEFIIVIPGSDLDHAAQQAERLRAGIESKTFNVDGKGIGVTISLGVAQVDPSRDPDLDSIVRRADEALYEAKRLGRNRVETAGHD